MTEHQRGDVSPVGEWLVRLAATAAAVALAMLVSLLPRALRDRWRRLPLALGTVLSALVQIALVGLWAVSAFYDYARAASDSYTTLMSWAHYTGFLIATPTGVCSLYLVLEGLVRLLSASAVAEPLGTLPVCLAVWLVSGLRRVAGRRALCRDIAVVQPDRALVIRTCRERTWDGASTLEYDGVYYQLGDMSHTDDDPRRPYRYRLDPVADDHPIRHVHHYAPDELL